MLEHIARVEQNRGRLRSKTVCGRRVGRLVNAPRLDGAHTQYGRSNERSLQNNSEQSHRDTPQANCIVRSP
ncbi:MAG TPA: hypothetical protein PKZ76_18315 [Xanthomonadaceae bacterium]|nr:hypothetical protein [Xanthomonadaceae bacterium]